MNKGMGMDRDIQEERIKFQIIMIISVMIRNKQNLEMKDLQQKNFLIMVKVEIQDLRGADLFRLILKVIRVMQLPAQEAELDLIQVSVW
jgi:hypothetical protein